MLELRRFCANRRRTLGVRAILCQDVVVLTTALYARASKVVDLKPQTFSFFLSPSFSLMIFFIYFFFSKQRKPQSQSDTDISLIINQNGWRKMSNGPRFFFSLFSSFDTVTVTQLAAGTGTSNSCLRHFFCIILTLPQLLYQFRLSCMNDCNHVRCIVRHWHTVNSSSLT